MTATTGASTPSSVGAVAPHKRADVQGLRAIAVLSVIAFHAGLPVRGGFTGVDIFFVISGFVITALILREVGRGSFRLGLFFARRAKRLLPALALMVAVVLVLSLLLQSPFGPQQLTAKTAIGTMLISANMVILRTIGGYFSPAAEANPLLHTWSLSVEEQFYLGFPLLLLLAFWIGRRRWGSLRVSAVLVAVLVAGSFTVSLLLSFGYAPLGLTVQPEAWAFYLAPTRAWEFGLGALIAIWLTTRRGAQRPARSGTANLQAVIGLVLVAVGIFWVSEEMAFPGIVALIPTVGTGLLILAGSHGPVPMLSWLSSRAAVAVGDRSYSLYLWHWPFIVFALILWPSPVVALLAAAASFIPAWLSYRWVEQPLRLSAWLTPRRVLVGGLVTSGTVILLALALLRFGLTVIPSAAAYEADRSTQTWSTGAECFVTSTFDPAIIDRCTSRVPDAKGWILLAGDSHASAASTGVVDAAKALGYDVVAVNGGLCPFVRNPNTNSAVPNCADMSAHLIDLAKGPDPASLVVLAQKRAWDGTADTVAELKAAGVPVLLVEDVPRWAPVYDWAASVPCSGGLLNFSCDISRSTAEEFAALSKDSEAALLQRFPDLPTYDTWPLFCHEDVCSPILDGRLAYFDSEHVNGLGSAAMATGLQDAMARAIGGATP